MGKKICAGKRKTGRKGMGLWHILVLAAVRHACGTNWDTLETAANYNELVRRVMGVHATAFVGDERIGFAYQNILDNVSLVGGALLHDINLPVVGAGHNLVKKKEDEALKLRTGSYAVEADVHFPTGLNLPWDSVRKCLDTVGRLQAVTFVKGWRKIKGLRKMLKGLFRATSQQVSRGKDGQKKKQLVRQYLQQARALEARCAELAAHPPAMPGSEKQIMALGTALEKYKKYVTKLAGQVERRLLKGEVIPAGEKVYPIFEEDTEWITKGRLNKKVELGHLVLVTTDQYQFIADYKVMEKQRDAAQVGGLCKRVKENFPGSKVRSHSFDKGFWSKANLEAPGAAGVEQPVLPKRGRHNKDGKARESPAGFKKLRNEHSAVESNINMLGHHGLGRCTDKGPAGFKRCVGLSVLAYNLHILGNAPKEKELAGEARREKARFRQAA